nr:MAG TPA_asm: RUBREDOXIN TRANSPORT, RUBREDOXIN, GUILLARDIA THETA [Caudoviricetes sp.]
MFSKKKTECRVCGYRFVPERENIYTAEKPRSVADIRRHGALHRSRRPGAMAG